MATTTSADLQNSEQEFNAAFDEPDAEVTEMGEEEAFGLDLPEGDSDTDAAVALDSDDTMKTDAEAVNDEAEEMAEADGAAADPAAEMPAEDGAEAEPTGEEDMPTDPKELQRMKSWEGRLRAREKELEAKAAEIAALSGGASEDEGMSEDPGEAVADLAAAVDSGEMTAEAAMQTLSDDFGPEFAKMLQVLVAAEASKVGSKVSGDINSLVDAIKDDKTRSHFEAIADAHPDFNEVADSEDMKAYLDSLDEAGRAKAEQVAAAGSTRQVIRFLDGFKAWSESQKAPAQEEPAQDEPAAEAADPAVDAAEGVRSTGLRLPEQPSRNDDYETAWSKF
ncbi:MAG: hypothetical protein Q7U48_13880 [Hydrogenophaga sp.]|nr:hypothetical protein [Hydrogenophaga sp.]